MSRTEAICAVLLSADVPMSIGEIVEVLVWSGRDPGKDTKASVGTTASHLGLQGRLRRVSYGRWVVTGGTADRDYSQDITVLWRTRAAIEVLTRSPMPLSTKQVHDAFIEAGRHESLREVGAALTGLKARGTVQRSARATWTVHVDGRQIPSLVVLGSLRDAVPLALKANTAPMSIDDLVDWMVGEGRDPDRSKKQSVTTALHDLKRRGQVRTVGWNRWISVEHLKERA